MLSHLNGSSTGEWHLEIGLGLPAACKWSHMNSLKKKTGTWCWTPAVIINMSKHICWDIGFQNELVYHCRWGTQKFNTKKKPLTTRLSWNGPFDIVSSKDRLLNTAALHQIVGKHGWTQTVLGVTGHKHQLHQEETSGVCGERHTQLHQWQSLNIL